MKILFYLSIVTLLPVLSCTSGKINSFNDVQGVWVSRFDKPVQEFNLSIYYQFTFKNDSFFTEIGVLDDGININYQPFRSKGTFRITGDNIILSGVAKAEGSTKYSLDYTERFSFDLSRNYLSMYSEKRWYLTYYDFIRKSPL
ncbi:MAG: hypothetical protein ABIY50_03165 [Ignavibacteria bacterium]